MGYNSLSESGMTPEEMRAEANRILHMIGDQMVKEMRAHEAKFITYISDQRKPVSVKQLFWLRDLREKYE